MAVVCAGVKSILDIGRTLEYLETQGVPVLTLGHDSTFPAFFTPDSGHKAPHHVKSPLDAARVIGLQCMQLASYPERGRAMRAWVSGMRVLFRAGFHFGGA